MDTKNIDIFGMSLPSEGEKTISITIKSTGSAVELSGKVGRRLAECKDADIRCEFLGTLLKGILIVCPRNIPKDKYLELCGSMYDSIKEDSIQTRMVVAIDEENKSSELLN